MSDTHNCGCLVMPSICVHTHVCLHVGHAAYRGFVDMSQHQTSRIKTLTVNDAIMFFSVISLQKLHPNKNLARFIFHWLKSILN